MNDGSEQKDIFDDSASTISGLVYDHHEHVAPIFSVQPRPQKTKYLILLSFMSFVTASAIHIGPKVRGRVSRG